MTKRLCFVCMGNICRSPMAEAVFGHLAAQAGLDGRFEVDSAGTISYHVGEAPDRRAQATAQGHGVQVVGRARQFRPEDFPYFDLILAMDHDNVADLLSQASNAAERKKVRLLREYDPEASGDLEVPDPYYGGPEGFERAYQIIERSCQGLLQKLVEG